MHIKGYVCLTKAYHLTIATFMKTIVVKKCVTHNWRSVDFFALFLFILLLITAAESNPRPCQPNLRGCAESKAQKQVSMKYPHTMPLQYLSGTKACRLKKLCSETTDVGFNKLVQYFSVRGLNSLNRLDWMKKNILKIFQKKLSGSPVFPLSVQFRNRLW